MVEIIKNLLLRYHPLLCFFGLLVSTVPSVQDHFDLLSNDYKSKTEVDLYIQESDFTFYSIGIVSIVKSPKLKNIVSVGVADTVLIVDSNWADDFQNIPPDGIYVFAVNQSYR
jgi:hypothetical protein